jgi:hypothetical protein
MLGKAAVVMWWQVPRELRAQWEDWHTHEHMPERLAIPGFLRGSRWRSGNSYFVLYEVETPARLTSAAYLRRLNDPTPWSRRMMPHHRNMVRSLCRVRASFGGGLSRVMGTLRLPSSPRGTRLLEQLPTEKGLSGAYLLQSAATPPQTTEQKIRGGDARADWVVLVGGYDAEAVARALRKLQVRGAVAGIYTLAHSL